MPVRVALPQPVDITPARDGVWTEVAGGRLWRLRFRSSGATDLSFGLDRFAIPAGAELYFVSHSERLPYYQGPYTSADVRPHGQLWSPVVPGGDASLELWVPGGAKGALDLHLGQVSLGFSDAFRLDGGPGFKLGSCNVDVVCAAGDGWRDQIRSVARYVVGSGIQCTGQMVMDAHGSFRPLFLTAAHCEITPSNAATVVTYWNYESPTCGAQSGGTLDQSVSGATHLAGREDVDFTLIELDSRPPDAFGVHWSGWDRSGAIPTGGVAIHHPAGDEKSISFDTDPLTIVPNCTIGSGPSDTHWRVGNWETGTTEGGSSGGGLWDPVSKLLVGFLSGGAAACGNQESDCFGRLASAWTGGAGDDERLAPHLDPLGLAPNTVAGDDPEGFALAAEPVSRLVCGGTDATYTVHVEALAGFGGDVALGVVDPPTGASVTFATPTLTPPASTTLTIAQTAEVSPGAYTILVRGTGQPGSAPTKDLPLSLTVTSAAPDAPTLLGPVDGASQQLATLTLSWSSIAAAAQYEVEIATDSGFTAIVQRHVVASTSLQVTLEPDTTYHWRVRGTNGCGDGVFSSPSTFTTAVMLCREPGTAIPDDDPTGLADALVVTAPGTIADLDLTLDVTHTWVGDLTIRLRQEPGGTEVTLYTAATCSQEDMGVRFDDEASAPAVGACASSAPAVGGALRPVGALSGFDGGALTGTWTLTVSDHAAADVGTLDRWCLVPTRATGTLEVTRAGAGSGSVSGPGIDCGTDCTEPQVLGQPVELQATAAQGSTFAGWTGCDAIAGATCTVTLGADRTVTAAFDVEAPTPPPATTDTDDGFLELIIQIISGTRRPSP
ncbi:MAG: proprotein convertase P-domain-containing protein [Chromatiales bacterium]|nr:proprotein convertase P-domain-containing protein [Chromatiales bacterium]